jgi:hypothetical protein
MLLKHILIKILKKDVSAFIELYRTLYNKKHKKYSYILLLFIYIWV